MAKQALIVHGGWDGHHPVAVAALFRKLLLADGFDVRVSDTLDAFATLPLGGFDLIVPHWTMGKITAEQAGPVLAAVRGGVGLAGVHGGMCDAFREHTDWQFMTGGQWVAHPGNDGVEYRVEMGPTARYMAPVSRKSKRSRAATASATVDFPVPAGPSIVITM